MRLAKAAGIYIGYNTCTAFYKRYFLRKRLKDIERINYYCVVNDMGHHKICQNSLLQDAAYHLENVPVQSPSIIIFAFIL